MAGCQKCGKDSCRHKDKARDHTMRMKYGITLAQFHAMLAEQGGRCAICRTADTGGRSFMVDHCHATGLVRGVLCTRCNSGLGFMLDNPETLRAAANYIEASLSSPGIAAS